MRKILDGVNAETTIRFELQPFQMTPGGQIPGLRESALVTTAEAISTHLGYAPELGNAGSANLNVPLGQGAVAIGIGGNRGGQRGFPDEWGDIPQMMGPGKDNVLPAGPKRRCAAGGGRGPGAVSYNQPTGDEEEGG